MRCLENGIPQECPRCDNLKKEERSMKGLGQKREEKQNMAEVKMSYALIVYNN